MDVFFSLFSMKKKSFVELVICLLGGVGDLKSTCDLVKFDSENAPKVRGHLTKYCS